MAQIRGRYLIKDFIGLVEAKRGKIEPKNIYSVILRVYSPEHPKITALVKMTAKGQLILNKTQKELDSIKQKDTLAFCHFQIEQVMR